MGASRPRVARARGAAAGESDLAGVEFCAALFADALGGQPLIANNSKWINFVTVRNRTLVRGQRRAARRRGAHGPLLDRLGDEARDGGRGSARVGVP